METPPVIAWLPYSEVDSLTIIFSFGGGAC